MMNPADRARRAIVSSFAGAAVLAAAGCTGGGSPQTQIASNQPRVATYRCGADGEIRIVNTGASVLVNEYLVADEAEGEEAVQPGVPRYEMVAAPPNQRSRYGAEGLALVLEGREALWMKAGAAPLTCTR